MHIDRPHKEFADGTTLPARSKIEALSKEVCSIPAPSEIPVSEAGFATDPEKLQAVHSWPRPSTVSEVRRFLGLCSYYRRFVPNFADLAHPLHQCTEHTQIFNWNDELENSFASLKKALTEAPVLGYPDREAHFVLDTDASAHGIGAVLSQIQNEEEQVVAYYSSTFCRGHGKGRSQAMSDHLGHP